MNLRNLKEESGFTLIELLIVVAVLAILATVVFIGIDPVSKFQDTRNSKRKTDVAVILNAIKLYQVDQKGINDVTLTAATTSKALLLATGIATSTAPAGVTCAGAGTLYGSIPLTSVVANGGIASLPIDPQGASAGWTATSTGYYLVKNANGTVTVGACNVESGSDGTTVINATR